MRIACTEAMVEQIVDLWLSGLSDADIGHVMGRSDKSVQAIRTGKVGAKFTKARERLSTEKRCARQKPPAVDANTTVLLNALLAQWEAK